MTASNRTNQTWVTRWDRQQELYIPFREMRFDAIFDTLSALQAIEGFTGSPVVVDLACGPGAIGQRLLQRFPEATCVGLDIDPVLLRLAAEVAAPFGDRFEVHSVDLVDPLWAHTFASASVDVITSSTALHWLSDEELFAVVVQCHRMLRPDGLFFDADILRFPDTHPRLNRLAAYVDEQHQLDAEAGGVESWKQWWDAARLDPDLGPLCEARDRRFPPAGDGENPPPLLSLYESVLEEAGFVEIATIWQRFDDRVLMARRASAE